MKKKPFIFLFALLLFAFRVNAQQQVAPPLVSVNGVGEVMVKPTEVVVSLGIEEREKTLDAVRKLTDKKAAAVINYLRKQGLDSKHVQTSFVTLNPIYNNGEFSRTTPDFYVAQKSMTITIKQIDKYDQILAGLYEVGVNRVDGVSFQVSDLEKYKTEARKKAILQAKQKAIALTSELGAKVGRVYAIDEGSSDMPRPLLRGKMESMSYDAAQGPSIASGELVVTSSVNVSFIIE
ncbi:SIMPL domain-containing protein [Pontibacter harenae]|uniref:SIMPL domain-containing protein n=1 Tax=Pontibacter harenae TaxID=2894083 RepID=UPI001E4B1FBB|nr:SIMPL domain-containing protein [Pontibacter harenae]MCC9167231.1 SIMPL domain-containing protein [Pontibacter harenae]